MKLSVEDLKKGLQICGVPYKEDDKQCSECPYNPKIGICCGEMSGDALEYIKKLEGGMMELMRHYVLKVS